MDQEHGKGVETDGKPQPPVDTQGQTTEEEGEMKSVSGNYPVENGMTETEISIRAADEQPADTPDSEEEKKVVKTFGNHVVSFFISLSSLPCSSSLPLLVKP